MLRVLEVPQHEIKDTNGISGTLASKSLMSLVQSTDADTQNEQRGKNPRKGGKDAQKQKKKKELYKENTFKKADNAYCCNMNPRMSHPKYISWIYGRRNPDIFGIFRARRYAIDSDITPFGGQNYIIYGILKGNLYTSKIITRAEFRNEEFHKSKKEKRRDAKLKEKYEIELRKKEELEEAKIISEIKSRDIKPKYDSTKKSFGDKLRSLVPDWNNVEESMNKLFSKHKGNISNKGDNEESHNKQKKDFIDENEDNTQRGFRRKRIQLRVFEEEFIKGRGRRWRICKKYGHTFRACPNQGEKDPMWIKWGILHAPEDDEKCQAYVWFKWGSQGHQSKNCERVRYIEWNNWRVPGHTQENWLDEFPMKKHWFDRFFKPHLEVKWIDWCKPGHYSWNRFPFNSTPQSPFLVQLNVIDSEEESKLSYLALSWERDHIIENCESIKKDRIAEIFHEELAGRPNSGSWGSMDNDNTADSNYGNWDGYINPYDFEDVNDNEIKVTWKQMKNQPENFKDSVKVSVNNISSSKLITPSVNMTNKPISSGVNGVWYNVWANWMATTHFTFYCHKERNPVWKKYEVREIARLNFKDKRYDEKHLKCPFPSVINNDSQMKNADQISSIHEKIMELEHKYQEEIQYYADSGKDLVKVESTEIGMLENADEPVIFSVLKIFKDKEEVRQRREEKRDGAIGQQRRRRFFKRRNDRRAFWKRNYSRPFKRFNHDHRRRFRNY